VMSLLAMSLRDWFCLSRKGGTEEGGWVHANGAKRMAVSRVDLGILKGGGTFFTFIFQLSGLAPVASLRFALHCYQVDSLSLLCSSLRTARRLRPCVTNLWTPNSNT